MTDHEIGIFVKNCEELLFCRGARKIDLNNVSFLEDARRKPFDLTVDHAAPILNGLLDGFN